MTAHAHALPGGPAERRKPAGLAAGAPLSAISTPMDAMRVVAEELMHAELKLRELVVSDVAAVPTVAGYLVDAGGKRFRPALTALGAQAVGAEVDVVSLMCAGELLHLGSLLHDDVVDDSPQRRDQQAAHTLWGNPIAVLSGDFCLARAVWLAAQAGNHRVVTELGQAVTHMAEGEVLQLQRAHDLSADLDGYLDVIERKSAALIAWCAAAPAWAIDDDDSAEILAAFGRRAGVAFQITDDVLDLSEGTGKPVGTDVLEGKLTLPLLYAMQELPDLKARIEAGRGNRSQTPALVQAIRDTGAPERALATATELIDRATADLHQLPPSPARDALTVLARTLVERVR